MLRQALAGLGQAGTRALGRLLHRHAAEISATLAYRASCGSARSDAV